MKNTLFILCEDVSVDKQTNQWTIFKHIEKINLVIPREEEKKNVSVKGKFNLVSFFREEKGVKEAQVKYQMVNEEDSVLIDSPSYDLELKDDSPVFKQRVMLNKLNFKDSGRYYFKVLKKDGEEYKEQSRIGIDVSIKREQKAD